MGYVDLLNADGHRELAAVKGADVDGAFVKSLSGLAVHANLANAVKHLAFTRCADSNLYGMVDAQIPMVEAELLTGNAVS